MDFFETHEAPDVCEQDAYDQARKKKIKSGKRRSSILKKSPARLPLEDMDPNNTEEADTRVIGGKKQRRSVGRRVSFAEKLQVKEFHKHMNWNEGSQHNDQVDANLPFSLFQKPPMVKADPKEFNIFDYCPDPKLQDAKQQPQFVNGGNIGQKSFVAEPNLPSTKPAQDRRGKKRKSFDIFEYAEPSDEESSFRQSKANIYGENENLNKTQIFIDEDMEMTDYVQEKTNENLNETQIFTDAGMDFTECIMNDTDKFNDGNNPSVVRGPSTDELAAGQLGPYHQKENVLPVLTTRPMDSSEIHLPLQSAEDSHRLANLVGQPSTGDNKADDLENKYLANKKRLIETATLIFNRNKQSKEGGMQEQKPNRRESTLNLEWYKCMLAKTDDYTGYSPVQVPSYDSCSQLVPKSGLLSEKNGLGNSTKSIEIRNDDANNLPLCTAEDPQQFANLAEAQNIPNCTAEDVADNYFDKANKKRLLETATLIFNQNKQRKEAETQNQKPNRRESTLNLEWYKCMLAKTDDFTGHSPTQMPSCDPRSLLQPNFELLSLPKGSNNPSQRLEITSGDINSQHRMSNAVQQNECHSKEQTRELTAATIPKSTESVRLEATSVSEQPYCAEKEFDDGNSQCATFTKPRMVSTDNSQTYENTKKIEGTNVMEPREDERDTGCSIWDAESKIVDDSKEIGVKSARADRSKTSIACEDGIPNDGEDVMNKTYQMKNTRSIGGRMTMAGEDTMIRTYQVTKAGHDDKRMSIACEERMPDAGMLNESYKMTKAGSVDHRMSIADDNTMNQTYQMRKAGPDVNGISIACGDRMPEAGEGMLNKSYKTTKTGSVDRRMSTVDGDTMNKTYQVRKVGPDVNGISIACGDRMSEVDEDMLNKSYKTTKTGSVYRRMSMADGDTMNKTYQVRKVGPDVNGMNMSCEDRMPEADEDILNITHKMKKAGTVEDRISMDGQVPLNSESSECQTEASALPNPGSRRKTFTIRPQSTLLDLILSKKSFPMPEQMNSDVPSPILSAFKTPRCKDVTSIDNGNTKASTNDSSDVRSNRIGIACEDRVPAAEDTMNKTYQVQNLEPVGRRRSIACEELVPKADENTMNKTYQVNNAGPVSGRRSLACEELVPKADENTMNKTYQINNAGPVSGRMSIAYGDMVPKAGENTMNKTYQVNNAGPVDGRMSIAYGEMVPKADENTMNKTYQVNNAGPVDGRMSIAYGDMVPKADGHTTFQMTKARPCDYDMSNGDQDKMVVSDMLNVTYEVKKARPFDEEKVVPCEDIMAPVGENKLITAPEDRPMDATFVKCNVPVGITTEPLRDENDMISDIQKRSKDRMSWISREQMIISSTPARNLKTIDLDMTSPPSDVSFTGENIEKETGNKDDQRIEIQKDINEEAELVDVAIKEQTALKDVAEDMEETIKDQGDFNLGKETDQNNVDGKRNDTDLQTAVEDEPTLTEEVDPEYQAKIERIKKEKAEMKSELEELTQALQEKDKQLETMNLLKNDILVMKQDVDGGAERFKEMERILQEKQEELENIHKSKANLQKESEDMKQRRLLAAERLKCLEEKAEDEKKRTADNKEKEDQQSQKMEKLLQITSRLLEWSIIKLSRSQVVFSFWKNQFRLTVNFEEVDSDVAQKDNILEWNKKLTSIAFEKTDGLQGYFEKERQLVDLICNLLQHNFESEKLLQKHETTKNLNKLLDEVSLVVSSCRKMYDDISNVNLMNMIRADGPHCLVTTLISPATILFTKFDVKCTIIFDGSVPKIELSLHHVSWKDRTSIFGDIMKRTQTGPMYFSRTIEKMKDFLREVGKRHFNMPHNLTPNELAMLEAVS